MALTFTAGKEMLRSQCHTEEMEPFHMPVSNMLQNPRCCIMSNDKFKKSLFLMNLAVGSNIYSQVHQGGAALLSSQRRLLQSNKAV